MIITVLKKLFRHGAARPKRLGQGVLLVGNMPSCPSCGEQIQLSPLAAASASCRCDCGAPLKVFTATACTEQLRAVYVSPEAKKTLLGCSFKVF